MYFKDLLRHRPVWLGVAMIWVILYHCPFDLGPLYYLKAIGYGGVDICIFASGIGCFYSLHSEPNVLKFMKRRVLRLAPTYIIFIIVWFAYQYIIGNLGFQMVIGNLFAIQNFTGHEHDFNWYISAIFLLYILAPYFKLMAEQTKPIRKIGFLVFLFMCSIPFWHANNYIITVTRLPIFYLGMIFADMCKKDRQIRKRDIISMLIAFILGVGSLLFFIAFTPQYLEAYGLYWYPFILITPPLCAAISYVSRLLEKTKITKIIVSFFSLCGDYSFELYLVHILLLFGISDFIDMLELSHISSLIWAAAGVLLIAGCFVLRRLAALFNRVCSTVNTSKQKQLP